jgi:hypothetical protein
LRGVVRGDHIHHSGRKHKQADCAEGQKIYLGTPPGARRGIQVTGHGAKYGRKQEEAIAALLTQRNVDEAAKAAGISTKTLLRWLKVPEFNAAYREARRAAFGQSVARLQQASSAAATTLLKIMLDTAAPPSTRVRAAECIMNHSIKAIEVEDIEARVSALEEATANQPKQ